MIRGAGRMDTRAAFGGASLVRDGRDRMLQEEPLSSTSGPGCGNAPARLTPAAPPDVDELELARFEGEGGVTC